MLSLRSRPALLACLQPSNSLSSGPSPKQSSKRKSNASGLLISSDNPAVSDNVLSYRLPSFAAHLKSRRRWLLGFAHGQTLARRACHESWRARPVSRLRRCAQSSRSSAWKRFLKRKERLLPQAKFFLPDLADWLEKALTTVEGIQALEASSLFVADQLLSLVATLSSEFDEQKQYFLEFAETLKETAMDPKWQGSWPGRSGFVAASMADARWDLTPSSSREMVRQERLKQRGQRLRNIWIAHPHRWWDADS